MTFSEMVRPLTINHDASLVYVNVNDLVGFEIGDIKTGKMIKRVELPGDAWKGKGYSHGIGMTPDESEIWVADPVDKAWQIWDNPGDGRNPVYNPSKMIKPTAGVEHSWIDMTNDGKLAPRRQHIRRCEDAQGDRRAEGRFGRRIVPYREGALHELPDGKLIRGEQPVCDRRCKGVCGPDGFQDE
jgi:hypothetical protein